MSKGLKVAAPPPRAQTPETEQRTPARFQNMAEGDKVQFNKRITRATADGYEMLSIRTRVKVPELLTEALELLEQKYGKL